MEAETVLTDNSFNKFYCEEKQRNGKVLGRRYWLRTFCQTHREIVENEFREEMRMILVERNN